MKLFLFDLDGTLVSTGGAGLRALSRAFEALYGIDDVRGTVNCAGKTDPAIFNEVVRRRLDRDARPDECRAIGAAYLRFLEEEVAKPPRTRVLAGVRAILDRLSRKSDCLVGLGTGNLEAGARIKLRDPDLNPFFRFGGFGSDAVNRPEVLRIGRRRAEAVAGASISSGNVYVIGDTPLDVLAAREAGFRSVAVASGKHTFEELSTAGAEFVFRDLTEASALESRWGEKVGGPV